MRAVPEPNEDVSDAMKADLDRFQRKAETKPDARASSANNSRWQAAAEPEPESLYYTLKDGLDKILIADFFLVLAILAWLVAGVAQNSALHSSSLLDAWYPLWPLVWQPAIGVLMAGALVSGGTNWVQQQLQEMQQKDKKGGR